MAINPRVEDVGPRYWRTGRAWNIYKDIAKYIIARAATARPVAFVVQGNPLFFNDICWEIARRGKRAGLKVQALPGVSCVDVLPIQLGFDMGDLGTQIFEATQLVMFALPINPVLSTLILQVAEFGTSTVFVSRDRAPVDFVPLVAHLSKFFPPDHIVMFVRSTSARNDPSAVISTRLALIAEEAGRIEAGMTLYVPRVGIPKVKTRVGRLGRLR
jgi:hypothetical protein